MDPAKRRRRESGFTLIEVAASTVVLVVGLAGLAVSLVYARNLDATSKRLWHATTAASSTLEQIRFRSRTAWRDVTAWNGERCDYGIGAPIDPYATKLESRVVDDETLLERPQGMWTSGFSVPNFYFVQVHTLGADDDFANSLDIQTYVADRSGLDTGGSSGGTGSVLTAKQNTYVATAPSNLVVSGTTKNVVAFDLANTAPANLQIVTVDVKTGATGQFSYVGLNGVALYDNATKTNAHITVSNVQNLVPGEPPGPIQFKFSAPTGTLAGKPLDLILTYSDKTQTKVTFTPQ